MSTIKGCKINVTVNVDVKAEEIKLSNIRKHDDLDERSSNEFAKGIDAKLGASIDLTIDEAEGDNLFGEIEDVVSDELANQLAEKLSDKFVEKKEEKVDKGE
ncbi:MAG: hypothetical protein MSA56_04210 [Clostridium sp.]|nr:hypothetical protein [Clostridium sp.]